MTSRPSRGRLGKRRPAFMRKEPRRPARSANVHLEERSPLWRTPAKLQNAAEGPRALRWSCPDRALRHPPRRQSRFTTVGKSQQESSRGTAPRSANCAHRGWRSAKPTRPDRACSAKPYRGCDVSQSRSRAARTGCESGRIGRRHCAVAQTVSSCARENAWRTIGLGPNSAFVRNGSKKPPPHQQRGPLSNR